MDPVTHSLVGASLSATGLRRITPLATATLVLGANAPDVDILSRAWGPWASLAWRRGITHGFPALLVLPLLVAGAILSWDRWIRRRRSPELPAARPLALLGLAALGVWTHSPLDWLNNYGMRWLLPFRGEWSYGDAVFILDPWLWLLLWGSLFALHARGRGPFLLWSGLGFLLALPVLLAPQVPLAARILWAAGAGGWILLRRQVVPRADSPEGRWTARAGLAAAGTYILLMVGQGSVQERAAREGAIAAGLPPLQEVMVAPVPANPLRWDVVGVSETAYHLGSLHWLWSARIRFREESLPRPALSDPRVTAALESRDVQRYLVWSRFPVFRMEEVEGGWKVHLRDARYEDRGGGALRGPTVQVPSAHLPHAHIPREEGAPPD